MGLLTFRVLVIRVVAGARGVADNRLHHVEVHDQDVNLLVAQALSIVVVALGDGLDVLAAVLELLE
jgi:hypothetical protein